MTVDELRRGLRQLPCRGLHDAAAMLLHILRQVSSHDATLPIKTQGNQRTDSIQGPFARDGPEQGRAAIQPPRHAHSRANHGHKNWRRRGRDNWRLREAATPTPRRFTATLQAERWSAATKTKARHEMQMKRIPNARFEATSGAEGAERETARRSRERGGKRRGFPLVLTCRNPCWQ